MGGGGGGMGEVIGQEREACGSAYWGMCGLSHGEDAQARESRGK